jgi:hypothetical protein
MVPISFSKGHRYIAAVLWDNPDSGLALLAIVVLLALTSSFGCAKRTEILEPAIMPIVAAKPDSPALYPISVEGKWGFIDVKGKVVIQPKFLSVERFSEGLAKVTVPGLTEEDQLFEREASGFIDEQGEFVIGPGPPRGYQLPEFYGGYSYGDFHEGRARFWVGDAGGVGGYIDRSGKLVIPPKYRSAEDFSQGLACVSLPRRDGSAFGPHLAGFIDRNGELRIPAKREFNTRGFSEGLCVIRTQRRSGWFGNFEWFPEVIDLNGKTVIPSGRYDEISDFVGGLACVVKNRKVGCIDRAGKVVIPIEFDQLWEFEHEDLSVGEKNGKSYVVDRSGRLVKEIRLGEGFSICRLRSGLAFVEHEEKFGYINCEGELTIPIQFSRAEDFHGELARVELGSITGYINRQGDFVWQTEQWDEPVHNKVEKPLSDFLPLRTVEAMPLEYNWQGVQNAIVFASDDSFGSLEGWFNSSFENRFKLRKTSNEPGKISISFYGEEETGSFHAVDCQSDEEVGFLGFYASKNMRQLKEKHSPKVVGILILDR